MDATYMDTNDQVLMNAPTPQNTPAYPQPMPQGIAAGAPYSSVPDVAVYSHSSTSTLTGTVSGNTVIGKPSTIKGEMNVLMGKLTNNPEKINLGNTMVAARKQDKALIYEQKALQYEQKGNMSKAQKNREKATKLRDKASSKLFQIPNGHDLAMPGEVKPIGLTLPQAEKAEKYDNKAIEWERKGNMVKAQKSRDKAFRLREKAGVQAAPEIPMTSDPIVPMTYNRNVSVPAPMGVSSAPGPISSNPSF